MSSPIDMTKLKAWVSEQCPGEDCEGCDSPECLSKGGFVSLKNQLINQDDTTNSTPIYSSQNSNMGPGSSYTPSAGYGHEWNKNANGSYSMDDYADPSTWKKNRTASNYDKGGEVEGDDESDAELQDLCAGELLESIEKKDKAGILEAIRAIVLSVR